MAQPGSSSQSSAYSQSMTSNTSRKKQRTLITREQSASVATSNFQTPEDKWHSGQKPDVLLEVLRASPVEKHMHMLRSLPNHLADGVITLMEPHEREDICRSMERRRQMQIERQNAASVASFKSKQTVKSWYLHQFQRRINLISKNPPPSASATSIANETASASEFTTASVPEEIAIPPNATTHPTHASNSSVATSLSSGSHRRHNNKENSN